MDTGDWASVASVLDARCEYHFRGTMTSGVEKIVESYRKIDEWVHATFDQVRYESRIELQSDGSVLITFRDQIDHGDHHLDFRCQQRVAINDAERIASITHIDIDGEPEKAVRFNAMCGVVKPA